MRLRFPSSPGSSKVAGQGTRMVNIVATLSPLRAKSDFVLGNWNTLLYSNTVASSEIGPSSLKAAGSQGTAESGVLGQVIWGTLTCSVLREL